MKHGLKALGLALLAAISVMALTAAGAQASNAMIIEGSEKTAETTEVKLEGTSTAGKLLVPAIGLELECGNSEIEGAGKNITEESLLHFHGTIHILFHLCIVIGNKFCKVYPTATDRTNKTNAGLLLIKVLWLFRTSGTSHYFLAQQIGASPITTIFLSKSTEGCTLPPENTVTGSAAYKIDNPTTEAVEHEVLDITPAEESTLGVSLSYGANPASLDEGTAKGHLVGTFLGKKFSVN